MESARSPSRVVGRDETFHLWLVAQHPDTERRTRQGVVSVHNLKRRLHSVSPFDFLLPTLVVRLGLADVVVEYNHPLGPAQGK